MKKNLLVVLLACPCLFLFAQHPNVKISDQSAPNEPSIAIDPQHPNRLVAGANLNNVYTSVDTGSTWTSGQLTSPFGVWGDPCVGVDTAGAFYFFHLSNPSTGTWIDRIVCQKSMNQGQLWSGGTFTGLNNQKAQDKHWLAINRKTNDLFITWTEFDSYGSNNAQDSSRILFSKSQDGGGSWSAPLRINKVSGDCVDSDNTVEGAVPTIGPNGEVYVAWAGPQGLLFDRSTDGGLHWLAEDVPVADIPGGWDYAIPGLSRCNGLPITACDLSNGPYHGAIYINWSDQRNGTANADIWLSKSHDGGATWTAPVKVNDDSSGRQQFMSWMAIDQATGWLWFVFYDRRNHAGTNTDVFMAVSKDGGATFQNFKVSASPFLPSANQFFGDYTNLTVHNNIVRPIWTRMDGNATSIWTALVHPDAISAAPELTETAVDLQETYPNPANEEVWVPFKIRRHTEVTMQIVAADGEVLQTIFRQKSYEAGRYTQRVEVEGLSAGTYWVMLTGDGKVLVKQMVVVK
ncbi:MAG: T9SS type A sorting domain-containing protein [Saprospiraceae bacterium]